MQRTVRILAAVLAGVLALVNLGLALFFTPPARYPFSRYHHLLIVLALVPVALKYGWPEGYRRLRALPLGGRLAVGLLLGLLVLADLSVRARTSPYPRADVRFYADLGFVLLGNLIFAAFWLELWVRRGRASRGAGEAVDR